MNRTIPHRIFPQSFFALLLALMLTGCVPLATPAELLVGTWRLQDADEREVGDQIVFGPNGALTLSTSGQLLSGAYQLDSSAAPYALDMDFGTAGVLAAIVAFDDRDAIRIAAESTGAARPVSFSAENTEVLARVIEEEAEAIPSPASEAPVVLPDRAGEIARLLRYTPDTPEYREYVAFGDYDAWLRAWAMARPDDIDDVLQMSKSESRLWKFRVVAQTTPPAAFGLSYLAVEDKRDSHGFSYFDDRQHLEAGAPPQVLTVITHNRDRADVESALTAFGYESTPMDDDIILYSIREDFEVDLESGVASGRLGELNRIAMDDDTLVIAGGTAIVEDALASAAAQHPSLADSPGYGLLLQSLGAPELADVGELVGAILFSADSPAANYADEAPRADASAEVVAQWERISGQQPPLPRYSLAGLVTYRAPDATYLGLHVVFPSEDDAEIARDMLAERLQTYVSTWNGTPLPWTLESAFTTDETAVILMRLDESMEEPSTVSWYDMIISADTVFLLSE